MAMSPFALPVYPSIYDREATWRGNHDWSRPLFVQASRQWHFDEARSLIAASLGATSSPSALLAQTWRVGPVAAPARAIVNEFASLDERLGGHRGANAVAAASVVVLTAGTSLGRKFEAVSTASNLIAFGLACERPVVVVDRDGLVSSFEDAFGSGAREIDGLRFTANLLMTDEEAHALVEAFDGAPEGMSVEVGRFTGGSTVLLGLAGRRAERAPLYSVDIERRAVVEYLLRKHDLTERTCLIDAPSDLVATSWRNEGRAGSVGFLFLDGDHSYAAVSSDIQHWEPLVAPGGQLALHDANMPEMGVSRAVFHHLPASRWAPVAQAGSLKVFRRL